MGEIRGFWAIAALGAALVCAHPTEAHAQTEAPPGFSQATDPSLVPEDTLETAYTLGLGTGVRAAATGTAALALNTSNMGATRGYHIEAFSQLIPGDGDTYWTIGSSVTDSATSKRIALGTSMRGVFSGTDRQYDGWDWRTGVGIQAIPQLGLGLGVRWARLRSKTFEGQRTGPTFNGVTLDASLTVTPLPILKIAGLGYNLVKTNSSLAPQMAGGSIAIVPVESFTAGADVLVDLSTFEKNELLIGFGAEFIASERVPLRIGYRRDNGRSFNQITAGAGYLQGRFGIEFSLRQTLGSVNKETYMIVQTRFVVDR
ncbi:MAG: hypothetical protein AAGF92_18710 [Myxococcota bacterium]